MKREDEVLVANAAFYRAFNARDTVAMAELWAAATPVTCVHPNWDTLLGRDKVLASWAAILGSPTAPEITCEEAQPVVRGEVAFVVCKEIIEGMVLTATNIFVVE